MKFSSKKVLISIAGIAIIILTLTGYGAILSKYNHTYTEDPATAQAADPFSCNMTKTQSEPQQMLSDKASVHQDTEKDNLINQAHMTLCTFLY